MASTEQHIKKIEEDIHSASLRKLCIEVVLSVKKQQKNLKREFFKFKNIEDHIKEKSNKEDLVTVLNYLSGESNRFLETKFQFIDDVGHSFIVPLEEIEDAMESGIFCHPETGREVNDFKSKIYIVYKPHEQ